MLLLALAARPMSRAGATRMFAGEKINITEDRAVLHVALRNRSNRPILVDGEDVMPEVQCRPGPHARVHRARSAAARWTGHTGERITDVVNIGIGGSDLGPAHGDRGAEPYARAGPRVALRLQRRRRAHRRDARSGSIRRRTLFIVASKTFTTQETMTNARSARAWLARAAGQRGGGRQALRRRLDQRRGGRRVRHRHRATCSASGTGSAGATRSGRRSACRSRSPSAWTISRSCSPARYAMDEHFRTAPLEREPAGACWG